MLDDAVEYKSVNYEVNMATNVLETKSQNGIKCDWSGKVYYNDLFIDFKWEFDWSELKSHGVDEITGHITVYSVHNWFPATKIDFLSYHSDFFSGLFSSNFKEGQMNEIPIEDVSYEDFALLLSSFYPNPVFPTDENVEKLLEMASRFMVSSVISIIEYHLLNNSRINSEKMLWMADEYLMPKLEYGMPKLLEKCIHGLDTTYKAENLKQSEEYEKLSDETKLRVTEQISKLSHI